MGVAADRHGPWANIAMATAQPSTVTMLTCTTLHMVGQNLMPVSSCPHPWLPRLPEPTLSAAVGAHACCRGLGDACTKQPRRSAHAYERSSVYIYIYRERSLTSSIALSVVGTFADAVRESERSAATPHTCDRNSYDASWRVAAKTSSRTSGRAPSPPQPRPPSGRTREARVRACAYVLSTLRLNFAVMCRCKGLLALALACVVALVQGAVPFALCIVRVLERGWRSEG
eukprot:364579-Chlamydomonas_euryale.AAC.6